MRSQRIDILMISLLVLLCCGMITTAEAVTSIRIHQQIELPAGTVRLGQIGRIESAQAHRYQQLRDLVVSEVAVHDDAVQVDAFAIGRALESIGVPSASVDIFGASACRVVNSDYVAPQTPAEETAETTAAATSTIQSDLPTLREHLRQYVADVMELAPEAINIEWRTHHADLLAAPVSQEIVRIVPTMLNGLGEVHFDLHLVGGVVESIRGRIEYLCNSAVAVRPIQPGQVIQEVDVKLLPRRVGSFREVGFQQLDQVIGREAATRIAPNQLLLPRMIRKIQVIKRKDPVEVKGRFGNVAVTFNGTALSDGGLGDVISVMNDANSSIIRGRVVGAGSVRVGEDESDLNPLASRAGQPAVW